MTHEEAKKMGATHYCADEENQDHFYKHNSESKSLMYFDGNKFVFAHNPEESFNINYYPQLKPL